MDSDRYPNPVDVHVGLQVRLRRKALKISQETLADALGLTFQQVQKYERGTNRISASKLYDIARTLQVSIAWFFEGLGDPATTRVDELSLPQPNPSAIAFLMTPEGMDLASLFPRLAQRHVRRRLVELIRSMVENQSAGVHAAITVDR